MTPTETAEALWAAWPLLGSLPEMPRPIGRILMISAHPDDEVLGAGGLIASLPTSTTAISFVTVTDGEASHPADVMTEGPATLARRRASELVHALHALGLRAPVISRWGLPDSGLAGHVDLVAEHIDRALEGVGLVVCPAVFDGHPDHAAVGRAAAMVCHGRVPLLEYPIWTWHWTAPGDLGIPWRRARRYELSVTEQRAKRAAIACFTTQVQPWPDATSGTTILPPQMLEHFTRSYEVFFT